MKITTILEGETFRLDSYGNGWAYTLTLKDKSNPKDVWLQDEDASRFREELDNLETIKPFLKPNDILGWLWDQCDYGALSRPCGDA